jgi:hypothetical protein
MKSPIRIIKDVAHTQAFGCKALIQLGSTAVLLGNSDGSPRLRIELFKPSMRMFNISYWRREGWDEE